MSELRQAVAVIADYTRSYDKYFLDSLAVTADEHSRACQEAKARLPIQAEAYARACREVNLRLAGFDHLLKVNQRSEAIRQAKIAPDLLDRTAELNFKEVGSWLVIAQQAGLAVPPKLNMETAARLNKAFADENRVAGLLAQHRSLALSRAPLGRRLDVVRLLYRAEPTNPVWQDDVRLYEEARFEELRREIDREDVRDDRAAVARLLAELSAKTWVSPVPFDLVGAVQSANDVHRARDARQLLDTQVPRLQRAMVAGENARKNAVDGFPGAADVLADRIEDVLKADDAVRATAANYPPVRGFRVNDLLAEADDWVKRAKKSLRRVRDFETAVRALDDYLKTGTEWYYVQEQYRIVQSFELTIPAGVLAQYSARAKSKRRLWLVGGAVAAAVAAAGAFFIIRS
jgi:hypothetical protein